VGLASHRIRLDSFSQETNCELVSAMDWARKFVRSQGIEKEIRVFQIYMLFLEDLYFIIEHG